MGRHERRHSFDFAYSNNEDYEEDKQRKVHFDDEYLACRRRQARRRSREDDIREMNVCETTTKLKESYENIDKGLEVLRRIYENLKDSKQSVRYGGGNGNGSENSQKEFVKEINTLLEQVEHLEKALRKSGTQKRQYLDELSHLQQALHEDRVKIESTKKRNSRQENEDLHAKMDESTKVTRDQQITINKLKRDNQNLWRILQEVKKHLIDEEAKAEEEITYGEERRRVQEGGFLEGCRLPSTPPRSEKLKFECELYPMREGSEDGHSSSGSCSDAVLSDKLSYLISRSENIQNMITKVGETRLNRSLSDDCLHQSSVAVDTSKRAKRTERRRDEHKERACSEERRIPAENEHGVRCDTKDIIRRCEELERRVEQCSTKDMRDRLIRQLEDIDQTNVEVRNEQREEEKEGYFSAGNSCFALYAVNEI